MTKEGVAMKAKRITSAVLILSLLAPPCALPARAAERESEPSLYLVYPDIQAEQTIMDSSYG